MDQKDAEFTTKLYRFVLHMNCHVCLLKCMFFKWSLDRSVLCSANLFTGTMIAGAYQVVQLPSLVFSKQCPLLSGF